MQQTETYKLNLIETSDTFSPNPLNENAQKLEAALAEGLAAVRADAAAGTAAEANARAAATAALEQRIITLEGKHVVGGTYVGTGSGTLVIELGFTPIVVFVYQSNIRSTMIYRGSALSSPKIEEGGFSVKFVEGGSFNVQNSTYSFIAVG